jgi:hypothetical protein
VGSGWDTGNAVKDGSQNRSWFVGHFIDPSKGVRHSEDVEVKWSSHTAGEKRSEWVTGDERTTLIMSIQGTHRIRLREADITLARPGDYAIWGPGIDHTWEAVTDTTVVTVRWPSVP